MKADCRLMLRHILVFPAANVPLRLKHQLIMPIEELYPTIGIAAHAGDLEANAAYLTV